MGGTSSARLMVLAALGVLALVSLLALPIEQLVPEAGQIDGVRWLALVQPAILLALAIPVGHALAPRVGLGAPVIDTLLERRFRVAEHRGGLVAAVLVAAAVAGVLIGYGRLLAEQVSGAEGDIGRLMAFRVPLVVRLLWGGLGEELLLRWGVMTGLVWLGWRLAGRPGVVPAVVIGGAILLAALLFAAGHLPILFLLLPNPPALLLGAVVVGNLLPGLLFGWLYWRHGLELAMLAHAGAHLFGWLAGA